MLIKRLTSTATHAHRGLHQASGMGLGGFNSCWAQTLKALEWCPLRALTDMLQVQGFLTGQNSSTCETCRYCRSGITLSGFCRPKVYS